jgi:crotonobetainyl-CoA:carnitine CoA-transferase CaiB-like acyl-CoA transferase
MMNEQNANSADGALTDLLKISGLNGTARIVAGPPLFNTRFAAADAAAAALAATGVAAALIQRHRTGTTPAVTVDRRHAEASLISFALQRFHDPARAPAQRLAPEDRTAVAGFYPAKDGRTVYLHAGFPHNTRGLLELLGVADDRAQVAAAVARRTASELENAIAAAGLCGAMVRTPAEWDASAPGLLLASRPVVDVIQVGEAPARPFPNAGEQPLDGIRVLDLTRVLAGPTCARTLAMYGAEALRVGAEHLPSIPLFVADTGLGKRAAFVDLTTRAGRSDMDRLLGQADVLSQSYRSGALDRLGFGLLDAVRARPGLIYVSINCYGHEGVWRTRPGWEQLAQTVTGMAHLHGIDLHGDADRPELQPAAVTDYTTGYLAAYGVLAALLRRAEFGGSYWVRVSLARTGMWIRGLGVRDALSDVTPLADVELAAMREQVDTAWGPLEHLRPPVVLSDCPVGWRNPPMPLGSCPPRFE